MNNPLQVVLITGMSGAGKSVAMQALEDANFYCVDNLPPQLIGNFLSIMQGTERPVPNIALSVDLRTFDFLEAFPKALKELDKNEQIDYQLVFLDANDAVLVQRYKQSRRRHPMMEDSPIEGIQRERTVLQFFKQQADTYIDTSVIKPKQLQEKMVSFFAKKEPELLVNIMSFGFKYGVPLDADLVFDVRFLPNPYYDETLRPKTGKEADVAAYVFQSATSQDYVQKLEDFIAFSLPQYKAEGKQQLVIAIGCTGGKHRSVAITERLGHHIGSTFDVYTNHRDIGRE